MRRLNRNNNISIEIRTIHLTHIGRGLSLQKPDRCVFLFIKRTDIFKDTKNYTDILHLIACL